MLWRYERMASAMGYQVVAGVDEVGMGPLAGPVVGGALVVIGEDYGEGASILQERTHSAALKSSMPLLDPRNNLQSFARFVEEGFALSEACNEPVFFSIRIRACHMFGSFLAKDNVAAWVNGKQVLVESPMGNFGRARDPWGYFRVIPVGKLLSAGANSLAAEAIVQKDHERPPQAGFIALLRVEMADGKIERFVSGPEWKTGPEQTGNAWVAQAFDDSAWPGAVIVAEVGQAPLGTPWPALGRPVNTCASAPCSDVPYPTWPSKYTNTRLRVG